MLVSPREERGLLMRSGGLDQIEGSRSVPFSPLDGPPLYNSGCVRGPHCPLYGNIRDFIKEGAMTMVFFASIHAYSCIYISYMGGGCMRICHGYDERVGGNLLLIP